MKNDPVSLMLYTVVKSLQELGYLFKVIFCEAFILLCLFRDIMLFDFSIDLVIVAVFFVMK